MSYQAIPPIANHNQEPNTMLTTSFLRNPDQDLEPDQYQEIIDDLSYSLAKRVPNMLRGFAIHTVYGVIEIDSDTAVHFEITARIVLSRRLKKLQSQYKKIKS